MSEILRSEPDGRIFLYGRYLGTDPNFHLMLCVETKCDRTEPVTVFDSDKGNWSVVFRVCKVEFVTIEREQVTVHRSFDKARSDWEEIFLALKAWAIAYGIRVPMRGASA